MGIFLALALTLITVGYAAPEAQVPATDKPHIVVGGDHDWPPYAFLDEQGKPSGFVVELFQAVAETVGIEAEIQLGPWSKIKDALEGQKIDAVIGMFYAPQQAHLVEFSQPYTIIHHGIFARKGALAVQSLDDLKGKHIIVQRDSYLYGIALAAGHYLVVVDTLPEAFRLLAEGQHDYLLSPETQGFYLIDKLKLANLTLVSPPFLSRPLSFAVPKGRTELLDKLNVGLDILKETGDYQIIYERWFGTLEPGGIPVWTLMRYAALILGPLLLILVGAALWSWSLRRQVTQRTRELQQAQAYLQGVFDSMPSVLVGVDSEMKIRHWNKEAEQTTGLPLQAVLGRDLAEIFLQFRGQLLGVRQTLADGKPRRLSKVLQFNADEAHYSDIVIYPLAEAEAVIRIDDVTDQVRLENLMVQTEKIMSLGGLAAGMAHEINNPLSAILLSVENILRRLSPELPRSIEAARRCEVDLETVRCFVEQQQVLEFLARIREQGGRAARIVANMLEFSRRSEGQRMSTDLPDLLDKTVALAENDYTVKRHRGLPSIEIIRDFDKNLPPVPCVGIEIEQVILNLIRNAAQALRDQSHPVSNPRIILRTRHQGDTVRIEVEDNGPGMDEATREQVFEPFFTTKPAGVGTGLGLSVSKFIITEHHLGTLTVESTPDKGTTFIICLPLAEAVPQRPAA